MKTDLYIYHSIGTNHNNTDDVAIVEAFDQIQAIQKFKEYYVNASRVNVRKIDLYPKGNMVQGIQIVSMY